MCLATFIQQAFIRFQLFTKLNGSHNNMPKDGLQEDQELKWSNPRCLRSEPQQIAVEASELYHQSFVSSPPCTPSYLSQMHI